MVSKTHVKDATFDETVDKTYALGNNGVHKTDEDEEIDIVNVKSVEDDKKKNLPIDRGWAWVVLVACFFEAAIFIGYFKCFGIFFVQYQRRFRSSSAATGVIVSLQNVFASVSALLVMNLGDVMTSRFSVVLGSVMVSASFLITGFMKDLGVVYFTGGVLTGTFFSFVHPQIVAMINTYFEKYRGLANIVAGSGVSIGALALAPLYTKAFEYYGFTGTFMITAGLFLNVAVVGMILRPMEYFRNNSKTMKSELSSNGYELVALRNLTESEEIGVEDESGHSNTASNVLSLSGWHSSLASLTHTNHFEPEPVNERIVTPYSRLNRAIKVLKTFPQMFNSGIIKKRVFQYYLLCNMFLFSGCSLVEGFIAPHAVDVDVENDRVSLLISSIAIADICSKPLFAYLSDRKWINRSTIMALATFILGVCSFFVFFMNSFAALLVFSIVTGSLQPVYFSLYPVIAVDILSLKELKSALGYVVLAQGITASVSFPFAGYLRDYTGRYYATFCFAGSMLVVGGLLSFFLPNVKTFCDGKRDATEQNADEEQADLK